MKHLRFILLTMVISIILSGCDPVRRYMGENEDLIATAIYAIPGIESQWNDNVQILDEDDYGRVLYAVSMSDSLLIKESWENCAFAILVMQKSEDGYAYFYAENNYLITVLNAYADLEGKSVEDFFSEEDILALKEANDWNSPYEEENNDMMRVPIVVDKHKDLPAISDKIIDTRIGSNYRYTFFREDQNGKAVYFVMNITDSSYACYLIIFSEEGVLVDEETSILEINLNKTEDLPRTVQEFLINNGWVK